MPRRSRSRSRSRSPSSRRQRYPDDEVERRSYRRGSPAREDRRDYRRRDDRSRAKDDARGDYSSRDYGRSYERDRDRDYRHGKRREDDRDRDRESQGPSRSSRELELRRRSRSRSPRRRRSRSASRSRSPSVDKMKPNFGSSGLLAAATNTVTHGDGTKTLLKYNEPPEARKPTQGWRLYIFKEADVIETLQIHLQSAYLFGRDRSIVDIPLEHPSCSKQHAVIQFRHVQEKDEYGSNKSLIKPYMIDLDSTNGTHVNGEKIPATRFYELKPSDVIKFGLSAREYVILNEDAK